MSLFVVISPIIIDFLFYKMLNRRSQDREKAVIGPGKDFLVCWLVIVSSLVLIFFASFFMLDLKISMVMCVMIVSLMASVFIIYKTIFRSRNHRKSNLTARSVIIICLTIVGFIIIFPPTNFWIGAPAGGWKYRWMERFKGASTETFIAVFGQPISAHEHDLFYGKFPWYNYPLPDDHLSVLIENDKIKGFIWH